MMEFINNKNKEYLRDFLRVLRNTNTDLSTDNLILNLEYDIKSIESLTDEDCIILVYDPQKKIQELSLDSCQLNAIEDDYAKTYREIPPPHHIWLFVCTHIRAHSSQTSKFLEWILVRDQHGTVVIIKSGDENQDRKAMRAIDNSIGSSENIKILFEEEKFSFRIPEKIKLKKQKSDSINNWIIAVSENYKKFAEALIEQYDAKYNAISRVINNYRKGKEGVIEKLEYSINKSKNKFGDLYDVLPDFDWLDALLQLSPSLLEEFASKESSKGDIEDKDDLDAEKEHHDEDKSDEKTPEKTESKSGGAKSFSVSEYLENNKDVLIDSINNECKYKIAEFLNAVFKSQFGLKYIQETILTSLSNVHNKEILKHVKNFLNDSDTLKYPEISNPPEWPLNHDRLAELIDIAIEENPVSNRMIVKILSILAKIKLQQVSLIVLNEYLDSWATKVYHSVLRHSEKEISKYFTNVEQWVGKHLNDFDTIISLGLKLQKEITQRINVINSFRTISESIYE